jgi:hypothetical protein
MTKTKKKLNPPAICSLVEQNTSGRSGKSAQIWDTFTAQKKFWQF